MGNNKQRRNRKNCIFYKQRGKKTAWCMNNPSNGILCDGVCSFFVDNSTKELYQPAVIKSVCDHQWQECESVMGDGVLCRKCNTVIKQTVL